MAKSSSKLLVLSAYTPNLGALAQLVVKNHSLYCTSKGYQYRCLNSGFCEGRAPSWSKILFILKALAERDAQGKICWDWVFWLDIDALITNPKIELEAFLKEVSPEQHMLLAEDAWGINTGLFFVRNSAWSVDCLTAVWHSDPEPFLRCGLRPPVWIEQARYIAEQTTLWHWLALRGEISKLKIIPYHRLGGYLGQYDTDSYTPRDQAFNPPTAGAPIKRKSWQKGDFCLHLAGVPGEQRVPLLQQVLKDLNSSAKTS